MTIFNVFTLMGGIAMFLYGMDLMGKALEQTAGSKLQGILSTMTSSPIRGLLLGMAVTAVIQSSGATTVMAVGFVNSGLMELHQAISVIMGANVGTTVTGWLLSLSGLEGDSFLTQMMNPTAWSPILGFIGIWMYMIGKDRKRGVGKILLGFSILMAGMNTMSHAMSPLADEPWFMDLFLSFKNPILGVIAGAVLTAVLQSSSASVGILQALTSTGAVTYSAAVPIIMGQNIGTTVTALISSAGANKNAKRTAFVHLYFNVIGTILFLCGFYGLNALIGFAFFNETANTFGIAIVHTIFNVVTTAILLPFNRLLEKLAILTVPDSPSDKKQENTLLDERLLTTPSVAVGRAMLTGSDMAEICRTALLQAMSTTRVWNDAIADEVLRKEDAVDHYEDVLGTYLVKLSAKHLSVDDNRTVNTLLHTIGDFERVSDHAVNIIKTAEEIRTKNIKFSEEALNDLSVLEAAVQDIVTTIIFASVLLMETSLLTSRVQLLMTGARATIGIALNADTIVSPPAPHLRNIEAITAMRYQSAQRDRQGHFDLAADAVLVLRDYLAYSGGERKGYRVSAEPGMKRLSLPQHEYDHSKKKRKSHAGHHAQPFFRSHDIPP